VLDDRPQLRERRWRRAGHDLPASVVRTAVTRASDEVLLRIPTERTPFVRAHGAECPNDATDVHDDGGLVNA